MNAELSSQARDRDTVMNSIIKRLKVQHIDTYLNRKYQEHSSAPLET